MLPVDIRNEIVSNLKHDKEVYHVILFGSYAKGNPGADSDIDIVVIINRSGFNTSYTEMLETRERVGKRLIELRKKIPVDLLVYTIDEWERLKSTGNDFIRSIEEQSVVLL